MGYRSDFDIYVQSPPLVDGSDTCAEVLAALETLSRYDFEPVSHNAAMLYDSKWYELEENLAAVSKAYPFAKITVNASGEDGAESIYNALGGDVICRDGVMTYPPNTLWEEKT